MTTNNIEVKPKISKKEIDTLSQLAIKIQSLEFQFMTTKIERIKIINKHIEVIQRS